MRKVSLATIIAVAWLILYVLLLSATALAATAGFVKKTPPQWAFAIGAYGDDGFVASQDTYTNSF